MDAYYYTPETFVEPKPIHPLVLWGATVASAPAGPVVIRNKDGHLQVSCWYRGPDLSMLDPASREGYFATLHSVVQRLGTGWCLLNDEWHVPARPYPATQWRHATGYLLDLLREQAYHQAHLHESWCHLTFVWRPPSLTPYWFLEAWFEAKQRRDAAQDDHRQVTEFVTQVRQVMEGCQAQMPLMRWCTPDETATYLHWCTSGDRYQARMPQGDWYLAPRLATGTLLTGREPRLDRWYLRCLGMPSWPRGDLGCYVPLLLQHLPFPYRWTVRFHCLSKSDAEATLQKYEKHWEGAVFSVGQRIYDSGRTMVGQPSQLDPHDATKQRNEEAVVHWESITALRQALGHGEVGIGYLTPTLLTWGRTPDEARRREDAAWEVLQAEGFIMKSEADNAVQAYLGTIPGDVYHNVRKPPLTTAHFTYLLSHSVPWEGHWENRHLHGPPLLIGMRAGAPFPVVTHVDDVGHTLIVGPTGSGKTAKLGLMGLSFLRYQQGSILAFDRKQGLYVTTHLADGHYYTIGTNLATGMQPLRYCGTSVDETQWCHTWVHEVLQGQVGPLSVQEKEETWFALERLGQLAEADRTLSNVGRFLQLQRLKAALRAFQVGGRYEFFDATQDSFALHAPWTTFAMDAILDLPEAIPPFLQVIFHRAQARFTAGRPVAVLVDELKVLSEHPLLGAQLVRWLTQLRSFNVSLWLATQQLEDVQRTPAWPAIVGSVRTWLFTPNERALAPEVRPSYEACDLTASDIAAIAAGRRYADYFYLSEGGKALYECRLTPAQRLLCGASGMADVAAFNRLLTQKRTEPLPVAWLRQQGCAREADLGLAQVPHWRPPPAETPADALEVVYES